MRCSLWILICSIVFVVLHVRNSESTNIVFILADDLGYGDLGFAPFNSDEFRGIQTPNLKRMSQEGITLTNFHAASPICSPSRASILTGLFPWRLGIDFIYSQDKKLDGSEELDHEQLPILTNIPMVLKSKGFYTAHVGKWHLGTGILHLSIR
jgi:arylsulfatase A-like enzyme